MIICIEGLDGSGKTTQVELLKSRFFKTFRQVEVLKFPVYDSVTGRVIRRFLSGDSFVEMISDLQAEEFTQAVAAEQAVTLQALMVVNRLECFQKLRILSGRGPISNQFLLILDRYNLSAMAYGMADGLDLDFLQRIHQVLPEPAHSFLLDISIEESFKRRPKRADAYEADAERLRKVRQNYLDLFARWDRHVLDGTRAPVEITEEIARIVEGVR